jgi:hypothetical protein
LDVRHATDHFGQSRTTEQREERSNEYKLYFHHRLPLASSENRPGISLTTSPRTPIFMGPGDHSDRHDSSFRQTGRSGTGIMGLLGAMMNWVRSARRDLGSFGAARLGLTSAMQPAISANPARQNKMKSGSINTSSTLITDYHWLRFVRRFVPGKGNWVRSARR